MSTPLERVADRLYEGRLWRFWRLLLWRKTGEGEIVREYEPPPAFKFAPGRQVFTFPAEVPEVPTGGFLTFSVDTKRWTTYAPRGWRKGNRV